MTIGSQSNFVMWWLWRIPIFLNRCNPWKSDDLCKCRYGSCESNWGWWHWIRVYVLPSFLKRVSWSFHDCSWEFPGLQQSGGCNKVSSADSANYLAFLQDLRQAFGPNKTIAAAVGLNTWVGPDKTPLTDVSAYAQVLDYICGLYSPSSKALTNPRLRQF